ncbi:MAG: amino acid ABC transporter permease [Desulfobacteraceae bacterium]|jgi:polar amino acid transport system permease protein
MQNSPKNIESALLNKTSLSFGTLIEISKYIIVIGVIIWLLISGSHQQGYNWQWYRVPKYIFTWNNNGFVAGPLLKGLYITLKISGISLLLSFIIGLATALLRLSDSIMGKIVARCYLELIRNTPLLVQLFFIYFVLGPILDIERLTSAVLALSLFEGAYASEIFRAGILSIPSGQWEAGFSLGLDRYNTYRLIILPQAIRHILPPLTNQAISLIKDSALVSTIAIYDLTMQGQAIIAETFLTFELWFTIAAIYLMLTISLSTLVNFLEKHFRIES